MTGCTVYGETRTNPESANLRGKPVEQRDQSGVIFSEAYDFKGNLLHSLRQLVRFTPDAVPADWNHTVQLDTETFSGRTRYDALNRPQQIIAPHSDRQGTTINSIQPCYNAANLLEQVHVWLDQSAEPSAPLDPSSAQLHAVSGIAYNAKGQRAHIAYGNGTATTYTYDLFTDHLRQLTTMRTTDAAVLQDLHYTYDPAGNITCLRDAAQQTTYFNNQCVEPVAEYTYDALYRLREASGREHLAQARGTPAPSSYNDAPRVGIGWSTRDGNAMGTYSERYIYDTVGNILEMQHRGTDPANPGWTRTYSYNEPSLIEPEKKNNRLTSTTLGGEAPVEAYAYDAHGNMVRMPHLQTLQWDFNDQLYMTRRQAVNAADTEGTLHAGERTWYMYDAAGQRVRKATVLADGTLKEERLYLGGLEIYRRHTGADAGLVRETLFIMDDTRAIAHVETRNNIDDGTERQLVRFQYGNHLGSAALELDSAAQIITYEEYTPFGCTAYQAVRSQTTTPKRYRYTGKERDEESGLYYHGARYYAPWLCRWTACDPLVSMNRYLYVKNNPVIYSDPTGEREASPAEQKEIALWRESAQQYKAAYESNGSVGRYFSRLFANTSYFYWKTLETNIAARTAAIAAAPEGEGVGAVPFVSAGGFIVSKTTEVRLSSGTRQNLFNMPVYITGSQFRLKQDLENLAAAASSPLTLACVGIEDPDKRHGCAQSAAAAWDAALALGGAAAGAKARADRRAVPESRFQGGVEFQHGAPTLPAPERPQARPAAPKARRPYLETPNTTASRELTQANLDAMAQEFLQRLPEKARAAVKMNETIAIGLVEDKEGHQYLVYTVAKNRTTKAIRAVAEQMGLVRWTATPRAGTRGPNGAPADAEQLLIEAVNANADYTLLGIAATRKFCKDCARAVPDALQNQLGN
jgi:RHS repeat-associated protein